MAECTQLETPLGKLGTLPPEILWELLGHFPPDVMTLTRRLSKATKCAVDKYAVAQLPSQLQSCRTRTWNWLTWRPPLEAQRYKLWLFGGFFRTISLDRNQDLVPPLVYIGNGRLAYYLQARNGCVKGELNFRDTEGNQFPDLKQACGAIRWGGSPPRITCVSPNLVAVEENKQIVWLPRGSTSPVNLPATESWLLPFVLNSGDLFVGSRSGHVRVYSEASRYQTWTEHNLDVTEINHYQVLLHDMILVTNGPPEARCLRVWTVLEASISLVGKKEFTSRIQAILQGGTEQIAIVGDANLIVWAPTTDETTTYKFSGVVNAVLFHSQGGGYVGRASNGEVHQLSPTGSSERLGTVGDGTTDLIELGPSLIACSSFAGCVTIFDIESKQKIHRFATGLGLDSLLWLNTATLVVSSVVGSAIKYLYLGVHLRGAHLDISALNRRHVGTLEEDSKHRIHSNKANLGANLAAIIGWVYA